MKNKKEKRKIVLEVKKGEYKTIFFRANPFKRQGFPQNPGYFSEKSSVKTIFLADGWKMKKTILLQIAKNGKWKMKKKDLKNNF